MSRTQIFIYTKPFQSENNNRIPKKPRKRRTKKRKGRDQKEQEIIQEMKKYPFDFKF